jgi:hypothetical protein
VAGPVRRERPGFIVVPVIEQAAVRVQHSSRTLFLRPQGIIPIGLLIEASA